MLVNQARRLIHEEHQYLQLIRDIICGGELKTGRNGVTKSVFGTQMRFNLRDQTIPLLTTKRVAWKTCLRELIWFVRGETDNSILQEKNVHIWDGNSTPEFMASRNLSHYKKNDLGPIYGYQWRHFNAKYRGSSAYYKSNGIDQLGNVIRALKGSHPTEDKYSRRLIVSAWNPCQLDEMALPPCHVLFQFYVNQKNELSCSLYQRSGDVGLGVPFNIASYSFLTHLIAHHCGLKTGEFIHTIGDAHIYDDHIEPLKQQIEREPYEFPKVHINQKFFSIDTYDEQHFNIENYKYHSKIEMEMRA